MRAAPFVSAAASTGRAEVLDTVLAAGGVVTLNAVRSAATRFDLDRTPDVAALLLSRAQPRPLRDALVLQPAPGPDLWRAFLACPVYAVLDLFSQAMQRVRLRWLSGCLHSSAQHCLGGGRLDA